ncbi:MAG: sugar ABC transporter permease [Trueperaceae bacterium]|nr:sugar ABC transporter permease [Trueperaceae bacterium]
MDLVSEFEKSRSDSRKRTRLTKAERREARWGYAFIGLWMVGFLAFYLTPMLASLVFSFLDFDLTRPGDATFVGFQHWRRLLFEDPRTYQALRVTFTFAAISLPIGMASALFLAILLNNRDLLANSLFRTLFYAPAMVPAVAGILIWGGVLNPTTGWINLIVESITGLDVAGPNGIRWLDDARIIYLSYTLIGLWGIGNAILYNLAALQGVPSELYEASEIDGASWWRRLWSVTVPMISPVIFYNLILSVFGLMQYFIVPYVLNGGNGYPEGTTYFYVVHFYRQSFQFLNMGYGSAIAWLLFIVALVITAILFGTSRRWVFYAGAKD